jgi:hypothetical protein
MEPETWFSKYEILLFDRTKRIKELAIEVGENVLETEQAVEVAKAKRALIVNSLQRTVFNVLHSLEQGYRDLLTLLANDVGEFLDNPGHFNANVKMTNLSPWEDQTRK